MKRASVVVAGLMLLARSLTACEYQARSRMEQAEDAYQQCLLLYLREPAKCDELKKDYEKDKAAYEKT